MLLLSPRRLSRAWKHRLGSVCTTTSTFPVIMVMCVFLPRAYSLLDSSPKEVFMNRINPAASNSAPSTLRSTNRTSASAQTQTLGSQQTKKTCVSFQECSSRSVTPQRQGLTVLEELVDHEKKMDQFVKEKEYQAFIQKYKGTKSAELLHIVENRPIALPLDLRPATPAPQKTSREWCIQEIYRLELVHSWLSQEGKLA